MHPPHLEGNVCQDRMDRNPHSTQTCPRRGHHPVSVLTETLRARHLNRETDVTQQVPRSKVPAHRIISFPRAAGSGEPATVSATARLSASRQLPHRVSTPGPAAGTQLCDPAGATPSARPSQGVRRAGRGFPGEGRTHRKQAWRPGLTRRTGWHSQGGWFPILPGDSS